MRMVGGLGSKAWRGIYWWCWWCWWCCWQWYSWYFDNDHTYVDLGLINWDFSPAWENSARRHLPPVARFRQARQICSPHQGWTGEWNILPPILSWPSLNVTMIIIHDHRAFIYRLKLITKVDPSTMSTDDCYKTMLMLFSLARVSIQILMLFMRAFND